MRRLLLLALAGLAVASVVAAAADSAPSFEDLPRSELQVVTTSGTHRFQVWVAADDRSRERGLMYVRELPSGQGMLFLFGRPRYVSFWMKNTYLSLDMVFINAAGQVVNVARDVAPLSEDPVASAAPVSAVLELVAGTAARIGLAHGDRIVHPAFASTVSP